MPGRYSSIIDAPWVEVTLFPESIPHLLHWDLAYLWILEKERHLRPRTWEVRTKAWRYLVASLLTSELEVIEEDVEQPMLAFTEPFGITKIFWVRLQSLGEKVGVLSPTVLVRPLPDFKSHHLERWKQATHHPEEYRPNELRHFIHLAVGDLRRGEPEEASSFRARLAKILQREFTSVVNNNPPPGRSISVPILRELAWTQSPTEDCIESINILIREPAGGAARIYLPYCSRCKHLLTKPDGSEPIQVEAHQFDIKCEDPVNPHKNTLNLSDFLIWSRERQKQVVVWDHTSVRSTPHKGFPPDPEISGVLVQFQWNAAQLDGERERRFIKLLFPDREVVRRKVDDVFFNKLLVPGKFESFSGLPIRPEWLDVLDNPHEVNIEPDAPTSKVVFTQMRLKGLPEPISRPFPGLSLQQKPKLAVGIYPDPQFVPRNWKWHRIFLHGPERSEYQIEANSSVILPWLVETKNGHPKKFSIISQANGNTGVTYWQEEVNNRMDVPTHADIVLGIDFGTTNTTMYFLPPDQIGSDPRPERHGLKPSEFLTVAQLLAKTEDLTNATQVGDFLPGHQYAEERSDPYVIPSAIWAFQHHFLIRWEPEEPTTGARPITGFKWDTRGRDFYRMRKVYLQNLLLTALPLIFRKTDLRQPGLKIHMGFAFPLAFDYEARERMKKLLQELEDDLRQLTGLEFESYSISESLACVRALGTFNPGETFLVADMGGATLDLAFFTVKERQALEMHQIGSIRFAGESYVRSLAEKKRMDRNNQDEFQWELRDLITASKCHEKYGQDQDSRTILRRFTCLAFEFLRTMLGAYRLRHAEERINLVLVGNGWHLAEAFTAETRTRGPRRVFEEYFNDLLKRLGEGNLRLYLEEPLPSLPSSKHLVVIGALRNASGPEKNREVSHEFSLSKLPAGRGIEFETRLNKHKRIAWSEIIGEGVPLDGFSRNELVNGSLNFFLKEMAPLVEPWRRYLLEMFLVEDEDGIPYPSEPTLRERIFNSIPGDPPKLSKGPLQIIIETHWVEHLNK